MAAASSAALIAPGLPIAKVPTGTPAGICTIENKKILPTKCRCFDGNPEHRKRGHCGGHARKMGGAASASDDDFKARSLGALSERDKSVWRPVRRDDQGRKADLELCLEKGGGVPHRLPIQFAAHDNGNGLF